MSENFRRVLPLNASGLAVFLGALDTYVVVSVLTTIMSDMNVAINHITRITPAITGYLLGYTVAMPLFGQSSDKFGRRVVLQIGLVIFIIGSVITACAHGIFWLVVGRVIQGLAGGALLPVSMALVADLWKDKHRSSALGIIGGAQELGSLVGPIYGIFIVELLHSWRYIFWINIPLAVVSIIIIHFSVPSQKTSSVVRIDIIGAILIALSLGLIILGLYNPSSDDSLLPEHGGLYLIFAVITSIAFIVWELRSSVRIIDPKKVDAVPFISCLLVSLCVGAALIVTMVDTELFARGIGELNQSKSIWFLAKFLIAVPIGAVLGGYLASRFNERHIVIIGMLISAVGYWRISSWSQSTLVAHYHLGIALPVVSVDLGITGLGIGTVIGPLASAILRSVNEEFHGIASAVIVVARTFGMLLGITSLGAWGTYRFTTLMSQMPELRITPGVEIDYKDYLQQMRSFTQAALRSEYSEIFLITAAVCVLGALCALGITRTRNSSVYAESIDGISVPQ